MHPIRLLHLPKTAGTTVASALLRVRGRKNRFVFSSDPKESRERFGALPEHERLAVRTFIGHSIYHTGIPEADDAQTITFLREPVSRVQSFVTYVAEGRTKHFSNDKISPEDFNLDEMLSSGNPELENLQTKALINRDHIISNREIEALGEDVAVELAIKNLFDGVTSFGLQDRFDEGWVAIWHSLGIKPPLYATMNRKRDTKRLEFRDEHIARIRELNRLDIRLYEAASQEFQRRIEQGIVPDKELKAFLRRQKNLGDRFSLYWNKMRSLYYASRRFKRRITGS